MWRFCHVRTLDNFKLPEAQHGEYLPDLAPPSWPEQCNPVRLFSVVALGYFSSSGIRHLILMYLPLCKLTVVLSSSPGRKVLIKFCKNNDYQKSRGYR